MQSQEARLTAQARLLSYPPLWCWEIVDRATGAVVASSWEGASDAYNSAGEALRQAESELLRLARGNRSAKKRSHGQASERAAGRRL
jgi:hypothetical protein